MKPTFNKTLDEQIVFWREVIGALNHPHRKKFQNMNEDEILKHCNRMINLIEKEKEEIK